MASSGINTKMTSTTTAHEAVLLPVTTKPTDNIDGCPICYDDNWLFADQIFTPTTKSDNNSAQNLELFSALPFHSDSEWFLAVSTPEPATETEEDGSGQSLRLLQALPFHLSAQETSSSSWCSLNPVSLACGHMFCLACIVKWIDKTETCPLCRQSIDFDKPWLYPPPLRDWYLGTWIFEVDWSADQLSDRFGLDSRTAREVCRLNRMTYREILAASIRYDEDIEIFVDIRLLKRRLFPIMTNIADRTLMPLVHSFPDYFKGADRILCASFSKVVTRALADVLLRLGKTLTFLAKGQVINGRRHHGLGIDWESWESGASYAYCVRISPWKLKAVLEKSVEGLMGRPWRPIPTPLQAKLPQDDHSVDYFQRLSRVWDVWILNTIDYLWKFACAWDQMQGILPSDMRERHALSMWMFENGERLE